MWRLTDSRVTNTDINGTPYGYVIVRNDENQFAAMLFYGRPLNDGPVVCTDGLFNSAHANGRAFMHCITAWRNVREMWRV